MSEFFDDAMEIVRTVAQGHGASKRAVSDAQALLTAFDAHSAAVKASNSRRLNAAMEKQRRAELRDQRRARFEEAPQVENGCDYSAPGRVLLRLAGGSRARLVWRNGARYTYGIGLQNYAPPELALHLPGKMSESITRNRERKDKGQPVERLAPATIERYRDAIDNAFGPGATRALLAAKLKRTVVL